MAEVRIVTRPHVIVGISGASGATIGKRIVERLAAADAVEIHLVVSAAAERTLALEGGPRCRREVEQLAQHVHNRTNIGASIASGSFPTAGMIVAPCSMRSLAAIAMGLGDSLLVRAADVTLKERRRLVLIPREAPLHLGHLRNLCTVTEMGAVVFPPVPAFHHRPATLDSAIDQIAARAIDLLSLPIALQAKSWQDSS
jgi:4-hydroxy-3-polyprenylbenzoate decarboxylase